MNAIHAIDALPKMKFGNNKPEAPIDTKEVKPNFPPLANDVVIKTEMPMAMTALMPLHLPLWRRLPAFFSFSNLQAGVKNAWETFQERKQEGRQWSELGKLAFDVGIGLLSHGLWFAVNLFFPSFSWSATYRDFFSGVHQNAAQKLANQRMLYNG